ncbi:TPA: recombinase family protein [Enterococcus faecium]|nr:recombinase family protein [Enterococcus faecium]
MDKFIKDLIIQILAMIAEQERTESKRRQAQGIKIAKANGVYKGRPKLYGSIIYGTDESELILQPHFYFRY